MQPIAPVAPVAVAGRVLLALLFIVAGYGKLTGLAGTAGYIASKGLPLPGSNAATVRSSVFRKGSISRKSDLSTTLV